MGWAVPGLVRAPTPPYATHPVAPLQKLSLGVMAAFYALAGANHFLTPGFYLPMMPGWLPAPGALIALSGAAEVALGLGLMWAPSRRWSAWGVVALLVAVYPANIHVAMYDIPMFDGPGLGVWNWVRVGFQPVLMAWAAWHAVQPTRSARGRIT